MGQDESAVSKSVDETDGFGNGERLLVYMHLGALLALGGELFDVSAKLMRSSDGRAARPCACVGVDADKSGSDRAATADGAQQCERG